MNMKIEIISSFYNPVTLKQKLSYLNTVEGLQLDLHPTRQVYRGIESSILVATISASSAIIGMIVRELIGLARQSKSKIVKITGKSGSSIEIPADTPDDKIREYIDLAKELDDIKRIKI